VIGVTPNYTIITPVRNEGQYLQSTIDSVVAQILRPQTWVIVDDGSTDNTGELIDAAARQHSWIQAVHRPDRGFRKQGGGVVEAFNDGFKLVGEESWDFIVKLDGDLSFGKDYFKKCLDQFSEDKQLGIGGGKIDCLIDGVTVEDCPGDPLHVRGATKIYRRATWEAIGGLIQAPGWDTLDEIKANMLGWKTRSFPSLRVLQHRETGAVEGKWKNSVKNGRANYGVGYHPFFMFCKCVRRLFERPYGVVSVGLWYGFLTSYLWHAPRICEPEVIQFLRREQMRRLFRKNSIWSRQ
jgi:poly-beta-1,6-N-acetyl-D-glucosamine synthase